MNNLSIIKNIKTAISSSNLELLEFHFNHLDDEQLVDIHFDDDLFFSLACYHQKKDVIEFLLTSPKLKDHSCINNDDNYGLKQLCRQQNVELVKYITTCSDIKEVFTKEQIIEGFVSSYNSLEEITDYSLVLFLLEQFKFLDCDEVLITLTNLAIDPSIGTEFNKLVEQKRLMDKLNKDLPEHNHTKAKYKI